MSENTTLVDSSWSARNNYTDIFHQAANVTTTLLPPAFEYALWQKIVFSCFMFPIIFFSIFGNILVIVAIAKFSFLRITNNIFLASLAVADCAVGILAMPPNAIQLLTGRWYGNGVFCRFWHVTDVLFSTSSILHLCCVSIDRYLSISDKFAFTYQVEHPTKSWRVRIMLLSVWITSCLLSFVPIFTDLYTTSEQAEQMDRLDKESGVCEFIVNMPYRIVSSIISFWIPGIAMVSFYSVVMAKAYRINKNEFKKYRHLRQPSNSAANAQRTDSINLDVAGDKTGGQNGEINHLLNGSQLLTVGQSSSLTASPSNKKNVGKRHSSTDTIRLWKREYKALITLGTVIIVFCLCWIFFFLRYTLCDESLNICPDFANNPVLVDILFWIGYFNSMINPFLYNFTNPDFRRAFKKLLHIQDNTQRNSLSVSSRRLTNTFEENNK